MRLALLVLLWISLLSLGYADFTRGVLVKDLTTGKVLVDSLGEEVFTPASVTKLVTLYLSLKALGPYFRFRIIVLYDPLGRRGLIFSDSPWLIEEFTGDPLNYLRSVIRSLPRDTEEVLLFKGDYPQWHPEWDPSFKLQPFAPFFTRFAFNENSFKLKVFLKSSPVVGEIYPPIPSRVKNELYLSATSDYWMAEGRPEGERWLIRAWGPVKISKPSAGAIIWAPVTDPYKFNRDIVAQIFRSEMGREISVKWVKEIPSGRWKHVATIYSPPLITLLRHQMYWSDNFVAESMLRYLVSRKYNGKLTIELEEKFLRESLQELKGRFILTGDKSKLFDGCGLSRKNRLSPALIVSILDDIYHSYLFPYILEILPSQGGGTLSERFEALESYNCRIYAKTGTLNGVSGLAGYLSQGNKWYAFAILTNGENPYKAKKEEERMILRFCINLNTTKQHRGAEK